MTDEDGRFAAIPIPGELAGLCELASRDIAIDLGESPEAWRGAAIMAVLIENVATSEAKASADALGVPNIGEPSLALLLTVAMLEQYPMWPEDGEKLMVDEDHPLRPHFVRNIVEGGDNGG